LSGLSGAAARIGRAAGCPAPTAAGWPTAALPSADGEASTAGAAGNNTAASAASNEWRNERRNGCERA
jgi:hypothetical protein